MSKAALEKYQVARSTQLQTNEARKMRALIKQARGNTQRSGSRWPFELTQNAHDPGPRSEGGTVNITLFHDENQVVFSHDGKPFSAADLAALLSGGSSKDFDSTETTGRFGTGFLLTHVLSCQIDVEGILDLDEGYEKFSIRLDRGGNEEEIFENTTKCSESIGNAEFLADINGHDTARFRFHLDCPEAAKLGVDAFISTLPYLYATCPHLGKVSITSLGKSLVFDPCSAPGIRQFDSGEEIFRDVEIRVAGDDPRTIRTVLFRKDGASPSGLVVVLNRVGVNWAVREIPQEFPKIFVRFPVRSSEFLPVNVVIDGRFNLSQERDSVLMDGEDKKQFVEAMALLPELVRIALKEEWGKGYTLSRVGMPTTQFGDHLTDPEKDWWMASLGAIAILLSQMPIVQTSDGVLHKVAVDNACADFITRRVISTDTLDDDALEFEEVWQAASETAKALPPALEISRCWTEITAEWLGLGVASERLALSGIADLVRPQSKKLDDLATKAQPLEWLVRFLNLVGKVSENHNCDPILKDFLPDQKGNLRSPTLLWRDGDIDEDLKDIADSINLRVRDRLLSNDLVTLTEKPEHSNSKALLEAKVSRTLTNEEVLEDCIGALSKGLPDTKQIGPDEQFYKDGSINLLVYLWRKRGAEAADLAKRFPFISSGGSAVRWVNQRKFMAPVSHWRHDAREFAGVYKEDRVLAEDYLTPVTEELTLAKALCDWGIAFSGPLYASEVKELRDERLKALQEGEFTPGDVVKEIKCSQIAFLSTELLQRSSADPNIAKLLLGLMVCHAARCDPMWISPIQVTGKRGDADVTLEIRPATWVADLKSRAWVPVIGEQGIAPVFANAGNLLPLLEPSWLSNNDPGIRLLCQFFGFKELDLQLLANAPTDAVRSEMEDGLARIVQTLGADSSAYVKLAAKVEADKKRDDDKERNRKFGLAIQDAIRRCMEANGLELVLIDCGYDYDVHLETLESVDAGTHHLKLADYFLEVKATTTGDVRLTPAQARTAAESNARFLLCVVDLRGIDKERMTGDWSEADVEPLTKIYRGIGELTRDPSGLVEDAKQCPVGIRNDDALRYSVSPAIWVNGVSIKDWIKSLPDRTFQS